MLDPDRGVLVVLDDVATALLDAGYGDPYATPPALRMRCLHASGCLEAIGARARLAHPVETCDVAALVVVALGVVLLIDHDSATSPSAIDDARDALHAVLRELD